MNQRMLYQQLVTVLEHYLGPTAERFVQRHVRSHLNKPIENLSSGDIQELAAWIKLSLAVLSEDKQIVSACEEEILALARDSRGSAGSNNAALQKRDSANLLN